VLSLYAAVAERSFRRYSTYTAATLAGIFTNSVFGLIYSFAYMALWTRHDAGGYDSIDAVTFVWLGQALLMTVALWGGGTTDDLAERIKTGDVAIDLYRPTGLVGWYLAGDLGRAAYHLVTRGLGPTFIGLIFFHIRLPSSPLDAAAFAVSLVLAVVVSFGLRFIVQWLASEKAGASVIPPLFWYISVPAAQGDPGVPRALQTGPAGNPALEVWPADIHLVGQYDGWSLLGARLPAGLGAAAPGLCEGVLRAATRKVVVQGG
jgi:ABC-2 type transport system permease protein